MVLVFEDITRAIIGCFYTVYNTLGYGLLESPYIGALELELKKAGHKVAREVPIAVEYDGVIVGSYRVDLLVDNCVIVEVKAEPSLTGVHERQLRNYLCCSSYQVGLLLGFGIKPQFKRFVHTKEHKTPQVST
jgi:GxxExxY protein